MRSGSLEQNLKPASSYISTDLRIPVKLRLGKSGLAADKPLTIPQFFLNAVNKFGQTPALVYQDEKASTDDGWTSLTFHEYKDRVEQVARVFVHLGLVPRTSVGILSSNCPEWFFSEIGALFVGGVVAGIYTTNSAEAVYHVLSTSNAGICVVDDTLQMKKVRTIRPRLPNLKAIIQIHGPFEDYVGVDEGYYRWPDLFAMQFRPEVQEEVEKRYADVAPNECALLIYTSGTVGMPKAVMLCHDSVIYNTKGTFARLSNMEEGSEVVVSYLPLSHIAAQIFDIFVPIKIGGTCYFADRNALKGTLGETLTKGRPTYFFGVPRTYEKIQENVTIIEANSSMVSKFLSNFSKKLMQNHPNLTQNEHASSWRYWLASKITARVKVALGLQNCKTFLIGGAPVSEDLKTFFLGLNTTLVDLFGMSELSGPSNFNLHPIDLESSGQTLDGTEMKIVNPNDLGFGEICFRGRITFMGYLNDMEATTACLTEDGWVHSGDVGYINTNGDLVISGRQKEIVITAGGENIPPTHIEALVKRELPGISNAVLIGDKRKYLTMLLTIKTATDPETARPLNDLLPDAIEWMKSLELPNFTHLSDIFCEDVGTQAHPKVIQSIQEGINRANKNAISRAHTIQKFAILPHDFSISTGELGNNLTQLPIDLFNGTNNLQAINLSQNLLNEIDAMLFARMNHLELVDLSSNAIQNSSFIEYLGYSMDNRVQQQQQVTLDLSNNRFSILNLSTLYDFHRVNLANNLWNCKWLIHELLHTPASIQFSHNYSIATKFLSSSVLQVPGIDCYDNDTKRNIIILNPVNILENTDDESNDGTMKVCSSTPLVWPKIRLDRSDSRSVIIWLIIAIGVAFSSLRIARTIIDRTEKRRRSKQNKKSLTENNNTSDKYEVVSMTDLSSNKDETVERGENCA